MMFRSLAIGLLPVLWIGLMGGLIGGVTGCKGGSSTQSATANSPQATVPLRMAGSSSAYAVMEALVQSYQNQTPGAKFNVLPKGQAETAIAGVKNHLVDVAFITRPLKPEEKSADLQYAEIAKDGLLVATHPSVTGVTQLTKAQLQAIYNGKITNWQALGGPNAEIILLDRPEDESAKRLLRQHYLGADSPNAPKAVVLKHETELITALTSTPYTIGAFSLAYAIAKDLPVNRFSLAGVEPTRENIAASKYPMVRHLGVVTQNPPTASVQPLIRFIQGAEGTRVLAAEGFTLRTAKP